MINLLIVDDHPVVLEGTKNLFEDVDYIRILAESNPLLVEKIVQENSFDLFLIDINMQQLNGIKLLPIIRKHQPKSFILFYTGDDIKNYYQLVVDRKIHGIVPKTVTKTELLSIINSTLQNKVVLPIDFMEYISNKKEQALFLNDKEKKILKLVLEGYTNKAIALEIGVNQRTIERHLTQLFNTMNVSSRTEAVVLAKELNFI